MSSSNYTSNLSLSQFESLDKPSWIQDYNSDMSKIDGACKTFTGTDGTTAGTAGFVPAPATTDADKFLKSDGTWDTAGGGSSVTLYSDTGTNTDGAMTQKCVTDLLFYNNTKTKIQIGTNASASGSSCIAIGNASTSSSMDGVAIGHSAKGGQNAVGIGANAKANSNDSIAIGNYSDVGNGHLGAIALGTWANAPYSHSVALGSYSNPRAQGVIDCKALQGSTAYGYQGTNDAQRTYYRVISGVHDGEDDHDVMTVGQVKTLAYKLVTSDPAQNNTPADFIGQIAIFYTEPMSGVKQLQGRFICTMIDSSGSQTYYGWSTF